MPFRLLLAGGLAAAVTLLAGTPAGAAPPCSKATAARVAKSSGLLGNAQRAWPGFPKFHVASAQCKDLTGDGRQDMVVLLAIRGGTGTSPSPWGIFNAAGGRYSLKLSKLRPVLDDLTISGTDVVTVEPVYKPADPNCCPSSLKRTHYRWNGRRYAAHH